MRLRSLALALLLTAAPADAADNSDTHARTFSGASYVKLCNQVDGTPQKIACWSYTFGAYDAYLGVNAAYILNGHPLYCLPPGGIAIPTLAQLTSDEIVSEKNTALTDEAADMVLTVLMGKFPCPHTRGGN